MADRDALVFEPFFRSRQVAYELQRLQTVSEQRKFTIYFERYGCLVCETRKTIHAGNGMCGNCRNRVFYRLTQIIAEGIKTNQRERPEALPGSKGFCLKTAQGMGRIRLGTTAAMRRTKPYTNESRPN